MLYDLGYGVISEYDRLLEQERESLAGTSKGIQGSTAQNIVNAARNNTSAQPAE
jgi:hypothetical protein